jgi:hypothetical protein
MAVRREIQNMQQPLVVLPESGGRQLIYLVTGILALLAVYVLMSHVFVWANVKLDDMRYGRPRTFHLTSQVDSVQGDMMTHFIAMNLNRQVMVLEIPGDDLSQMRTLSGPYLFGAGEDLTPVTLHMEDVNSDGANDLILQVKDEAVIYLYRGDGFSLVTPEERQQIYLLRGEG